MATINFKPSAYRPPRTPAVGSIQGGPRALKAFQRLHSSKQPAAHVATAVLNESIKAEVDRIVKLTEDRASRRLPTELLKEDLETLVQLSKTLGYDKVTREGYLGSFTGVLTTSTLNVSADGFSTLGKLSFRQYYPTDMQIKIDGVGQQLYPGRDIPSMQRGELYGLPEAYVVPSLFQLVESGLFGLSTAIAKHGTDPEDPTKLNVEWYKLRLEPAPCERADPARMRLWLDTLKPHNPNMGEDGVLEVLLEKAPKTYFVHLMTSPEYQLLLTQFNNYYLLKRIPDLL